MLLIFRKIPKELHALCIGYSMFCVGYEIYTSGAPACIFHNKHKTLYNLFSPDPAVSYVADTQASHPEI